MSKSTAVRRTGHIYSDYKRKTGMMIKEVSQTMLAASLRSVFEALTGRRQPDERQKHRQNGWHSRQINGQFVSKTSSVSLHWQCKSKAQQTSQGTFVRTNPLTFTGRVKQRAVDSMLDNSFTRTQQHFTGNRNGKHSRQLRDNPLQRTPRNCTGMKNGWLSRQSTDNSYRKRAPLTCTGNAKVKRSRHVKGHS